MPRFLFAAALLCICSLAKAQVIIKNVNLIDVEKQTILKGRDVLAKDGKIQAIGKSLTVAAGDSLQVIDGTGKYLMPGLTDAHIHFFQSGGLYARPDAIDLTKFRPYKDEIAWVHKNMEDFMRRYLKAGITGVIDVGANEHFLKHRDSVRNKWFSPDIRMTGALLTTYVPKQYVGLGQDAPFVEMTTEEATRNAVRKQLADGADFIKIWYIVQGANKDSSARKSLPLVSAAIDEAHKNKLRVAVHATELITATLAVEAGADFLVHNVEDTIVTPSFIRLLKERKTVVSPTLVVAGNYTTVFGKTYRFSNSELSIANPTTLSSVIDYPYPDTTLGKRYMQFLSTGSTNALQKTADSISAVNLLMLANAGVIIATGTDAGNIGTHHASSYFNELAAMQLAGMSNWQILKASTINGALAVGTSSTRGSITKGKDADMILLAANPVDSLSNLRKLEHVIRRGTGYAVDTILKSTPEMLAQQQLNAYNQHNLEAFLEPYAEDVEIYDFPDKLVSKGKAEMRKSYQFLNNAGKLYCRLLNRMVQGNMVIDHEEILGVRGAPHYGIAIYEIENGKIKRVYFPK